MLLYSLARVGGNRRTCSSRRRLILGTVSPRYSAAYGALASAERAEVENSKSAIVEARTRREIAEQRADAAKRAAARAALDEAPDASGRAEEARQAALMVEAITVPATPRLLVDDSTPEALVSLMAAQGGRVAVLSAEGGIFDIISGKYSRFPSFDVYLKGHAGDELRIDRKGRDAEFIDRPTLTVGLAIQPAVLRAIAEHEGFRGRGLLARFLFCLPTSFVGHRKIGTPATPQEVIERYDADMTELVLSLAQWTDPALLTLTPEAAALLIEFERDLNRTSVPAAICTISRTGAPNSPGRSSASPDYLHLATHLRTGWREPIDATTFANAVRIGTYFRAHAVAVFAHMGGDPVIGNAQAILRWIADSPDRTTFTRRDAHRALAARFVRAADLDAPLALLEDYGWIRPQAAPPPRPEGGRPPSPRYEVHPDAHR